MQSIYRNPKIATPKNHGAPYRGEWIIYQYANREYAACHEIEQPQGERKVVETISPKSLADAQLFSGYLSSYGWSKVWDLQRAETRIFNSRSSPAALNTMAIILSSKTKVLN